ncbi:MAG TPA: peptidylprolyl isomerase [Dissulfurispiraceae bacterium]|nr:peptidylprolyl isomerase [Dissulfurispiraceae bacterium]
MKNAESGNKVRVHYTGSLDDGAVFDSSRDQDPLEFILGSGQLIRDFEDTVIGMAVGESKTVHIPAERAYGVYNKDLLIEISRENFSPDMEILEGISLCMQRSDDGQYLAVVVKNATDTTVTVDANHPPAGMALTFNIEVVEIS